jgi:hypothetical protein
MMFSPINRREFVRDLSGAGALAAVGDLAFLQNLPSLSAAQVRVHHHRVRFSPDTEPLVRLIEDTPRERLLEEVGQRIRTGTSYQQLLTALMLAGVRGIQPRPVGFKFHAVLVVNSAHLASLAAEDRDRWLPLFWSLDNFKVSQARNRQEGDWSMSKADEARLPTASQARARFIEAMDNWEVEGADRAVTALVRTAGAGEIIELFWRYGARDFRDIGHKAIFAANGWRTLQTIGWRHAEPVMRSLAYALLEHEGGNPAQRDAEPDRPWRENIRRAARIRADWQRGRATPTAATELLATMRTANAADACERVVALLNAGVSPDNVWDGLFMTAGELLMRQPGIVGLHCVTSVNALHFGSQASGNDETRRMLMLQAAAFLTMFRARMQSGRLADLRLDTLEPMQPDNQGPGAVEEIFAEIGRDRVRAARKTLAVLQSDRNGAASALMTAARRLIFLKGNDSHDYKFSSAALEDFFHATPAWRNRFLASSMFHLKGSGDRDNDLIRRARTALG